MTVTAFGRQKEGKERERMEREVTKKGQRNVEMELNFIQLF